MTVYQPEDKDRVTGAVAPFPPERPEDDGRPVTQREAEARAAEAALAGEHGTDGPPQYVDAPMPEGHHAGDYSVSGDDTRRGTRGKGSSSSGNGEDKDSKDSKD